MIKNTFDNIDTIFWDWNGTLLDDMHICVEIMNDMLGKRKRPILSHQKYQSIFTFPVSDYYKSAGIDLSVEGFEAPATEFIEVYNRRMFEAGIHQFGPEILKTLNLLGLNQFIISAMKQGELEQSVKQNDLGIYFNEIKGIDNHYAQSKTNSAQQIIDKHKLDPLNICVLGDTLHDHEVAEAIGCSCILIAQGHQSMQRLKTSGRLVIADLADIHFHLGTKTNAKVGL
jgi:phosphoglycolate phosphatase